MTASRPQVEASEPASAGFIIIAVLWIVGALSALASIYVVYVVNSAAGFAAYERALQAEALVAAAVEVTAYQQLAVPPPIRPSHGAFNFRVGSAAISVAYQSEAARIDLNAASKPLVAGLF